MPALAHNVFFTLNDNSEPAKQKLLAAFQKYLTGHKGMTYFASGVLCPELTRPVNDLNFDVALHMEFESLADHDAYQVAPRHNEFIDENKANWKTVRVFDWYLPD